MGDIERNAAAIGEADARMRLGALQKLLAATPFDLHFEPGVGASGQPGARRNRAENLGRVDIFRRQPGADAGGLARQIGVDMAEDRTIEEAKIGDFRRDDAGLRCER